MSRDTVVIILCNIGWIIYAWLTHRSWRRRLHDERAEAESFAKIQRQRHAALLETYKYTERQLREVRYKERLAATAKQERRDL